MKKKVLLIFKIAILSFVLSVIVSTTIENIVIKKEINDFTKLGVLQEEISTATTKYYLVYDENEANAAFTIKDNIYYPGVMGDIIIGLRSPFPDTLFDPFLTFFVGGHAALCAGEYVDQNNNIKKEDCVEATGDETLNNGAALSTNRGYWLDNDYRTEAIGIRVKCDKKTKEKAFSNAISYINDPYNSLFVFDTNNKKYCTDIISQAYKNAGVNLNKDGLAVTVMDLAFNNNTYIFYYRIVDKYDVAHVYYRTNNL